MGGCVRHRQGREQVTLRTITFDTDHWQVVPRELPGNMIDTINGHIDADSDAVALWRDALIDAPEPPAQQPMTDAATDVLAERRRQVEAEGWTPEHDDEHARGEIALAAACYALSAVGVRGGDNAQLRFWPWDDDWWRPSTPRRDLIKAGALILAEIERLDRVGKGESDD